MMARVLIVATGGAGGDLPPLVAASLALRDRGHEITFVGDASVEHILAPFHVAVEVLPKEVDLGPRLAGVVQDAMQATGGDLARAGPMLQRGLTVWAHDVAQPLSQSIERQRPTAIVTSLFGVEAVDATCPSSPWAVVNSTFYIGPHPPRPVEDDIGPRALPLVKRYAELLEAPDLVLHATDQVFDYSFDRLPSRHHYVGPLGIWEPPRERPSYLDAPAEALGVAEVVPCAEASAERIGAAVRRSLTNRDMAATAARHSARLRATDPPATAAAHLESLL